MSNHKKYEKFLNKIVSKYNNEKFIISDPIEFPYHYQNGIDIEIVAYISAMFSYGNVPSIKKFLNSIFFLMGVSPVHFLINEDLTVLKEKNLYYRFQNSDDIYYFLKCISVLLKNNSSLEPYFGDSNLEINFRISHFQKVFQQILHNQSCAMTPGLKFLIGTGNPKSANKRYFMFLRWMVRNSFPDFGIYKTFRKQDLKYPLDVHILNFSKKFGINTKKSINYKLTCEITDFFRELSPFDPLIYDFPLSRLGILKQSR
ncbi:MAG: TIGR02757 family protein [Leptospiraceae bacterium]|nr:TIGR02757 family protein [Leptospiraceae bacterium]MCP5497846.1 TIGR02757 family protein [Leptospiraceae bacterium]